MAQTGSWNGYTFSVSSKLIRSFEEMTLKGSCETENKTAGAQNYVSRKNGDPMELSFSVVISALLGVTDVRREAIGLVKSANKGDAAYFYYGSKKLIPPKMMLTQAEITDIDPMPKKPNQWISCTARLTFKQASDNNGKAGGESASGSKKSSVKGSGAKKPGNKNATTDIAKKVAAGITAVGTVISLAKQASSGKLLSAVTGGLAYQESVVKKVQVKNTQQSKPANTGRIPSAGGTKWLATQR